MDGFVTWQMLAGYPFFVSTVWLIVEITKEKRFIKKIPTKDYAFLVTFVMMVIVNLYFQKFQLWDIFIYAISSLYISLGSNGMADRWRKKDDNSNRS